MVAIVPLGLGVFTALAASADAALAGATAHVHQDPADRRMALKLGADAAQLGLGTGAANIGHYLPHWIPGAGPLVILYLALDVFVGLEFLNGRGIPIQGSELSKGASMFFNGGTNDVFGLLDKASPQPVGWQGQQADSYADANTLLASSIDARWGFPMVAADNEMARIVETQAEQVTVVREGLAITRKGISAAIAAATKIPYDDGLRTFWAIAVAAVAGGAAAILLIRLRDQQNENAAQITALIDEYHQVARTANEVRIPMNSPFWAPDLGRPPGSGVSDLPSVPSGTTGHVAVDAVSGTEAWDHSPTPRATSPSAPGQLASQAPNSAPPDPHLMNVPGRVVADAGAGPNRPAPARAQQAGQTHATEEAAAEPAALPPDAAAGSTSGAPSPPGVPAHIMTASAKSDPDQAATATRPGQPSNL